MSIKGKVMMASVCLLLLSSNTAFAAGSYVAPPIAGPVYPDVTESLNKVIKADLANITTPPKYNDLAQMPIVNLNAAVMLIEADEIATAFIDNASNDIVLNTTKGGRLLVSTMKSSEYILPALINFEVKTKYVDFEREKVTSSNINSSKQRGGVRYLFFALLILGVLISFKKGGFRKKKERVVVKDGQRLVQFETRDGTNGLIPEVSFKDVAGCEEAIEDLQELAQFLKDPERYNKLGAKIPRGAILSGPPGTGKTLLARAVAGEAGVPFFSAAGSDFVEMYVGVGASRVRELFAKAKKSERAIIFIDEIDAIAKVRSQNGNQGNDEREGTLNALLHELDGFNRSNVILLAATNRVELLDPAILRPGRLDRKISVPNPDRNGRFEILKIHARGKPLAEDADLELIAKRTPGMSGAELSSIINEAAIEAARRDLSEINASCLSDAVALIAMGRARKSAIVTEKDRLITAWHEAGHTITALLHPDSPDPVSVSITPRGHAGGITWMSGSDDLYLQRKQAAAQLVVALGGRAAEEIILEGEFTQGPSSDLQRATDLATMMVNNYGMTRRGLTVRESDKDTHEVVEELLSNALVDARELLLNNIPLMESIVTRLLEVETLEYTEILEIKNKLKERGIKIHRLDLQFSATMMGLKKVTSKISQVVSEKAEKINELVTPETVEKNLQKNKKELIKSIRSRIRIKKEKKVSKSE